MEKPHIAIIAIVVVIVAIVAIVGFGGFIQLGVQNETYYFDGCTLSLPSNVEFENTTAGSPSSVYVKFYYITDPNTNEEYSFDISRGSSMVSSADSYIQNLINNEGATEEGNFQQWTIINLHGTIPSEGLYHNYLLIYHDGITLYEFCGDNLQTLENVAQTFST